MIAILLAAGLGSAQLHASCAPAAQKPFLRGVLLLHSFMYEDAREAFRAASAADGQCAIARWGEAMTWDHPLWGEEDVAAGRKALEGVETKGLTPLEAGLVEAAGALYEDGDSAARHGAWRDRLARLHAQLPMDDEAQLFYALSLIATSDQYRNVKRAMEAGALALEVFGRNPNHPGAAHYVIHAFDTPDHAVLALPAARRYAQIAPEAGHALHMPSHIFIQLGMWRESESSNVASFAASEKDWARHQKREHWRDWHSVLWLANSRLELGRASQVLPLLETMRASMEKDNHPETRWSYAFVASMWLSGTQRWDRADELLAPLSRLIAAEDEPPDPAVHCPTDLPGRTPAELMARVMATRARMLVAANTGDEARVQEAGRDLDALLARVEAARKGFLRPDVLARFKLLTPARIAQARARKDPALLPQAIDAVRALADADDKLPQVGPIFERPARIDLGDLLAQAGRAREAMAAFRAALDRRPNQSAALLGLARAAKAAGDAAAESEAKAALAAQWRDAEQDYARLVQTASAR